MCGIAGFAGLGSQADIEAMTAALYHRGPDGNAVWHRDGIALGHTRLAILDIPGGAQPMWSEDGRYAIVYNGEIYNHDQLRHQLEGAGVRFQSDHSDTETLLLGYREWGADLCEKLNGMWAFAILDRERNELFLSRDRFGQKPLFYYDHPQCFAFASEANALLAHQAIDRQIDPIALGKYFGYGFIPAPRSLFRGIAKLPGGCNLTVNLTSGERQLKRWWQFRIEPTESFSKSKMPLWCEEFRHLLNQAVQKRLSADVPVGVFLSGGIDSSSVAYFASQSTQLQSFSVGFEEASFDEREQAAHVANHLGLTHHLDVLSWQEGSACMNEAASRLDEPMGDVSLLPCHLLGRFAAKHIKVALGGDGADELLAGYDPFKALRWAKLYAATVPKPLHRVATFLMSRWPVSHRNMSLDFKIKRTLRGLDFPPTMWLPAWMSPLTPKDIGELLNQPVEAEELFEEAIQAWDRLPNGHLIDRTSAFFSELYLQDDILVKIDRANMWHGLEARAPFLDIDLVNFLRKLPHQAKFGSGTTKLLLKQSMKGLLPERILGRRKKGFGVPIGRWFRENPSLKLGPPTITGMDPTFVDRAYNRHRHGKTDERLFLWCHWLLSKNLTSSR